MFQVRAERGAAVDFCLRHRFEQISDGELAERVKRTVGTGIRNTADRTATRVAGGKQDLRELRVPPGVPRLASPIGNGSMKTLSFRDSQGKETLFYAMDQVLWCCARRHEHG